MSASGAGAPPDGGVHQLRVTEAGPLTAGLVARVEGACDRAEDSAGTAAPPPLLVVELPGTAGPDDWPGGADVHLVGKWERALRRLERLAAVTAAVVSGDCRGPALELLLATDLRLAEPGSTISFPAPAGGSWPGMAVHRLANQVGLARARRLVLFGGRLDAAAAAAAGLVDAVCEEPRERLGLLVGGAGPVAGKELAIRRRLVLDAATTSFEEALGVHLAACDRSLRTRRGTPDGAGTGAA